MRLMITLSYYRKFNLSNCKVESRDGKVLREEGEAREVHDDEDFTGGTVIIRVDLSKSCESLTRAEST